MTTQVVRHPAALLTSQLIRLTSASVAVMLLAVAAVHLFRNSLGRIEQPDLSIGWLLFLLVVGVITMLRYAWQRSCLSTGGVESTFVWVVASLAALVWACSLTVLAGNFVEIIAIWLVLFTSEGFWWLRIPRHRAGNLQSAGSDGSRTAVFRRALMKAFVESGRTDLGSELDESIVQQLTRSVTEEHGELIHGVIRCRFRVGERSHVEHVAFCPPLEAQPSILVDQIDGPTAKVKVAQAESFGVRFEIRLDRVCRRESNFVFEFFANGSEMDDRQNVA